MLTLSLHPYCINFLSQSNSMSREKPCILPELFGDLVHAFDCIIENVFHVSP